MKIARRPCHQQGRICTACCTAWPISSKLVSCRVQQMAARWRCCRCDANCLQKDFPAGKLEVFILEILFVAHLFIPLSAVRLREVSECVCVCESACLSPDTTWPYFTAFKQRVNTHAYCKSPLNARKNFTIPNMRFS